MAAIPTVARLVNGWVTVYAESAELLVMVGPSGDAHERREVRPEVVAKLLENVDAAMADRKVEAICQLHFEPEVSRIWAELRHLAETAAGFGYGALRYSSSLAVSFADLEADQSLESMLCERDAECDGQHLWLWVNQVDGSQAIYHFDYEHASIVPPKPLWLLVGS